MYQLQRPQLAQFTETTRRLVLHVQQQTTLRSLFHFRFITDLNEFYLYDYLNFYRSLFTSIRPAQRVFNKQSFFNEWRRLGFIHNIRRSLLLSLRHTMGFIGVVRPTLRKQQFFTQTIKPAAVLGYL
jgi:hypothetical protein